MLTTRRLRGRITLYDYQALCKEYTGSSDSARMLSDVSVGGAEPQVAKDGASSMCGEVVHICSICELSH